MQVVDYSGLNPDLWVVLPEIIVTVFAVIVIFIDLFTRHERKTMLLPVASIVGYLIALAVCIWQFNDYSTPHNVPAFGGMMVLDNLGLFFKIIMLVTAIVTVLISTLFIEERGMALGEYYAILALATVGMMITSAATDLTTIFAGIELSSISVYILTGFNRRDKLSNEAAIKYFLLGLFSTAILVYGMAWLYGMTGYTNLRDIGKAVAQAAPSGVFSNINGGLALAMILLIAGLGFKVAAVPFHMWTPDAYQGAPTPVTAMMSVGPKAAGFAAIVRILIEALGPAWQSWVPIMVILSILTMTLGNIVAVSQRSVKRMLAYSSIAHTGYVLVGVASFTPQNQTAAVSSVLFYMFSYLFMNMGAFGIVIWLQRQGSSDFLQDFRGISTWAPGPAALMAFFLLSLTGIPPTIGFLGKYYVFLSALNANLTWLAVIGVLNSAVGAFYYLRIIWYMYFEEPRTVRTARPSTTLVATLAVAAGAVVVLFIFASPILDAARNSMPSVAAIIGNLAGK